MPPPDPKSSTTSPGFKSIRAVGFPHPRDASTAFSGISPFSSLLYRLVVIGSQHRSPGSQQACTLPCSATAFAALPYFCLTSSLTELTESIIAYLIYAQTNIFFTIHICQGVYN